MNIQWSQYSANLFEKIQTQNSNIFVNAVAGAGKTTNLVHIANNILKNHSILCVSFNNAIANELKRKIHNPNATVGTLHSIAFNALKPTLKKTKIDKNKYANYFKNISAQLTQNPDKIETNAFALQKIFNLALLTQSNPVEIATNPDYDIPVDLTIISRLDAIIQSAIEFGEKTLPITIDFIDMLYFANKYNKTIAKFDHILVDEAQDLSNLQIDYLKKFPKKNATFIFFGDKFQSIYAFAGANHKATQTIISTLNCQETPLSICYRCPITHIELAKTINPTIEAHANAKKGIVETIREINVANIPDYTLVISRTNFPLFSLAFKASKIKKIYNLPAKNIALSLYATATIITDGHFNNLTDFEIACDNYIRQKTQSWGQTPYLDILIDKINTLKLVINETPTIKSLSQLKTAIINLAKENLNSTVTFCSIHRAKGLEAPNVIFINPNSIPHKKAKNEFLAQEFNLKYVGYTRSTNALIIAQQT